MNTLKNTIDRLPGETGEIQYAILPFNSPINILQQTKAQITTNPFVKPIEDFQNKQESEEENDNKNMRFREINEKLSINFMGFLEDLVNKPDDKHWHEYLKIIIIKDDRSTYLGILQSFLHYI